MSFFGRLYSSTSLSGRIYYSTGLVAPWTPDQLFAQNEVGAWYDPSDLTTLFQNTGGTTPVTAAGQRVALMLDKSRGLVLGPELVTDPASATLVGTGTWVANGGGSFTFTDTVGGQDRPGVSFATSGANRSYLIKFTLIARTIHPVRVQSFSGSQAVLSGVLGPISLIARATGGDGSARILLEGAPTTINASFTVSDISVRELPGNHATQSVLAQQPLYAVEPVTGRRNLLTYTEQFDNAEWLKLAAGTGVAPVVTANQGVAPDGTTTADRVVFNRGAGTTSGDVSRVFQGAALLPSGVGIWSVWMRSFDGASSYTVGLTNGSVGSAVTVTGSWQRFSLVSSGTTVNAQIRLQGDITQQNADLLVWGAQLETGSTATAYQRVVSQHDVSEAGVEALHYLSFDGIDDGMLTGTITPGADKVAVFAGVRKLSDAARGTIAELTASAAANNGAFHLTAPNAASTTFAFESKGTTLTDAVSSGIAAPATRVLAGLGDIAGDTATLRVNGVQADQDTGDQGTGNYAAAALYLGRRGGTSLPFSGHLYGAIFRFSAANLGAAQIAATERWMAGKTGVTI